MISVLFGCAHTENISILKYIVNPIVIFSPQPNATINLSFRFRKMTRRLYDFIFMYSHFSMDTYSFYPQFVIVLSPDTSISSHFVCISYQFFFAFSVFFFMFLVESYAASNNVAAAASHTVSPFSAASHILTFVPFRLPLFSCHFAISVFVYLFLRMT